jgi:hypothetical protein
MSAFGTKKETGDEGVQLTFPSVYESVYASHKIRPEYFPTAQGRPMEIPEGEDFQANYHEQKRKDANVMAMAKVQSTKAAEQRFLISPHGYYNLPPVSLAQRKFANPSSGAVSIASSRRDGSSAPFVTIEQNLQGGVLRSAQGQAYGKAKLRARIGQLEAIDAAKAAMLGQLPSMPSALGAVPSDMAAEGTPMLGESSKIELNLLLQSLIDALMAATPDARLSRNEGEGAQSVNPEALTRFAYADATRALALMFRFVPLADAEELEDLMEKIDVIVNLIDTYLDPDLDGRLTQGAKQIALSLSVLFTKVRDYLTRMMSPDILNRPERERLAASRAFVKTLGFAKMLTYSGDNFQELLSMADRDRLLSQRQRQIFDDDDDDDDEDRFDRPAMPREDEEHEEQGGPARGDRGGFDEDERQTFGNNSGAYFGEAGGGAAEGGVPPPPPSAAPSARASDQVRRVYDRAMEGYDVAVEEAPAPAPAPAPRRRLRVERTAEVIVPSSRAELPTTMPGYRALADYLNSIGGIDGVPIRIGTFSDLRNVRKNFIRRLGL